jgi:hypothetical protein
MTTTRKSMVTLGTDGNVDYVQIPTGQKFSLGPVSVLHLISKLSRSKRVAKNALEAFLSDKQVMLNVDLDHMWALLPFRRARYSSTNSFMSQGDHSHHPVSGDPMIKSASYDTFVENVGMAEEVVHKVAATNATIDTLVAAGKQFNSARAKEDLLKIAARVAEIAQNVDMAQPWVGADLADLVKKASAIYALFPVEE